MASQDYDVSEFLLLMRRAVAGCKDAEQEIVEKYGEAIRRAVRRVLGAKLRPLFDSVDFVQLVWGSVFRSRARLEQFNNPGEFVAYLAKIARNKVAGVARDRSSNGKDGANRGWQPCKEPPDAVEKILDGQPAAVDMAIAHEKLEGLLAGQPPLFRKIITLRLQGLTHDEIARALGVNRGVVYRFLARLSRENP